MASRTGTKSEDYATQKVSRLLWRAGSQATFSLGVYGIYALTNAWFVSWGVGSVGLAAVNFVSPIQLFIGAIASTVGVGGASLVSRKLGSRDIQGAARSAGNTMALFAIITVTTTILMSSYLEQLLRVLGVTSETADYAKTYASILIAGSIFATGFSSIVRAEGRLFFATLLWIIPVGVQLVLDPILIFGFKLGIAGAAYGTVGGQAVSAAMAMWYFFVQRNREYTIRVSDLVPRMKTVYELLSVGSPTLINGLGVVLLTSFVNLQLSFVSALAVTGFALVSRMKTFITMPLTGIAQGLQPIVGFNAGRNLNIRVQEALTVSTRAIILIGGLLTLSIVVFAHPLAQFFLRDGEAVKVATQALEITGLGLVFAGIPTLISAYFQALGKPSSSYAISIGTVLAIKLPLVIWLGNNGLTGIWWAIAIGEAISALAAGIIFRLNHKKNDEQ